MIAKQLSRALRRIAESDVERRRTTGFQWLASRPVRCGSEHAFQLPMGYSCRDVESRLDTLIAAVGAPIELIDRGGAVVIRVVNRDFPMQLGVREKDIKEDGILIGYNRLMQPIYHPLNTHVLVGGASGSGKTDGLRFWVWQLLRQGYEVRVVDMKGFSFFPFEGLPGVRIAKNLIEAHEMLVSSICELMERKERVIRSRSRDIIKSFKPIVLVVDEAAALAPKQNRGRAKKLAEECDEAIALFGQQAREPKMFMLYSTQRPSVDIINLQFRANVEAMISFRTRDRENSRLIIGKEGAELISPATPGRCIYAFDRDHTLQVPYVGNDTAWSKLLQLMKTEVLNSGNSSRSESQRVYIDGLISGPDSDDKTDRHAESILGPNKEGQRTLAAAAAGGIDYSVILRPAKDLEGPTYTDEIADEN